MRRFSGLVGLSLALALPFGSGCSCGGSTTENQRDGAADTAPQFDAIHDQGPVQDDGGASCGTFKAADGCGFELTRCTTVKNSSDECGGDLDCIDTGLYGLQCLKKCGCSAECGINTICLPSKASDYVDAPSATQFTGSAKGHCYYSFCGGQGDATSPLGNGNFFGACTMGAEDFLRAGAVQPRPGTCYPIFSDVPDGYLKVGQCQEAGSKPRGATCSFDPNQCYESSTFDACAVGAVCIGHQGNPAGTCAKMCNPKAAGFNPAVPGDCAADSDVLHDQYCQDSSNYQWDCTDNGDAGVAYVAPTVYDYVGFCVDTQGCDIFAAANNCATTVSDGGVAWNGCEPTSEVNSYGLCGAAGTVALGGECNNTTLNCQKDLVCITLGSASTGACEKYCGLGPNDGKWPCESGQYCDRIRFGSDPGAGCWNDPLSLGFGICKPDTRQDGGT